MEPPSPEGREAQFHNSSPVLSILNAGISLLPAHFLSLLVMLHMSFWGPAVHDISCCAADDPDNPKFQSFVIERNKGLPAATRADRPANSLKKVTEA
jgi:hypothetical protein